MDIYRYFLENADKHSESNAYLLALLSRYIYEDGPPTSYGQAFEERFKNLFGDLSSSDPFVIELYLQAGSNISDYPYDTQVAILSNSKVIVVAFRGSEAPPAGIRDWLTNLGAGGFMMNAPTSWGPVQVHTGFYNALDSKYFSIKNQVNTVQSTTNPKKVFITGHSLGGALATLCAYRFQKVDGISVAGVYTFGAPKVGDHQFSNNYSQQHMGDGITLWSKTYRWMKNNDFAAKLPVQGGPIPLSNTLYHHVGIRKFIKADGSVDPNSTEPTPSNVPPLPLSFSDHIMSNYSSSMYFRLSDSTRNSVTSPSWLVKGDLLGTVLERCGDSGNLGEFVREIAAVKHRTQQVVSAIRTQDKSLKLISWRVNDNGSVSRTGDSGNQAGSARNIDIAKGNNSRYVTACRNSADKLRLISWGINAAGTITRTGDSANQGGIVRRIKLVGLSSTLFLTACRTDVGKLNLISWRRNSNGSITKLNDSESAAGAISELYLMKISHSGSGSRIVTSVRDSNGDLKLIVWNISSMGTISRLGDSGNQGGKATMIRSVENEFGDVITATQTGNGNLELISWKVSANGNSVTRLGDSGTQAGKVSENALMSRPGGVVSAVQTSSGKLKLIAWPITAQGKITRAKDRADQVGAAALITYCQEGLNGNASIVTLMQTASKNLKLITWRDWV